MWIKKEKSEVILMEPSKAFNTTNHSLLLEKLGFPLDRKINFEAHVRSLCKKAGHKINRLTTYFTSDKETHYLILF